jgi:hypothetical protein
MGCASSSTGEGPRTRPMQQRSPAHWRSATVRIRSGAADNGYRDDHPDQQVAAAWPPIDGRFASDADYISVTIRVRTEGALVRLFYGGTLESTAQAIGWCNFHRVGGQAALFAGSSSCQNALDWGGSNTVVEGDVHSNNDMHLAGQSSVIRGAVTYVDSVDAVPGKVTYDPPPPYNPIQVGRQAYPIDFTLDMFQPGGSAASQAAGEGRYVSCDCKMNTGWLEDHGHFDPSTNQLASGLYYSSDSIRLSVDGLAGSGVTLASAGEITLSGSSQYLTPYLEGLVAFSGLRVGGNAACNRPAIRLSGSDNQWLGVMFAPNGAIQVSGASTSTLQGSVIGYTLSLNGASILIRYDPAYLPPPPPAVGLAE